jgi:hypothetical protein
MQQFKVKQVVFSIFAQTFLIYDSTTKRPGAFTKLQRPGYKRAGFYQYHKEIPGKTILAHPKDGD